MSTEELKNEELKTRTINIDLNKIKVRDTEDRDEWIKLIDREIKECQKKGIPYSIQNEVNAPMNVEKGEDLRSYTVEKSKYAEEHNTNNWKENIHKVTGYLKLGGLITEGELKGLYYNIIDIDRKSAWEMFLGNDTEEELVSKYPWIEYHREPNFKRHINLVSEKPIPYLKETTVIDNDRNTLGIGVFSDNTQWVTGIHSINVKSGKLWTIVPNGYKSYKVLSEEEYNDIVERVARVCRFYGKRDYGNEQKQEEQKHKQQDKDKAKEQGFNKEQEDNTEQESNTDQEFDEPTQTFIDYTVSVFEPYFEKGLRDKIVFNLSGYLAKMGIHINICIKVIETLQIRHNQKYPNLDPKELEKIGRRVKVIINSYHKVKEFKKVEGYSALKNILKNNEELLEEFNDKVKEFKSFSIQETRLKDIIEITTRDIVDQYPVLTLRETLDSDKPDIRIYDKEEGYYSNKKTARQLVYELYPFEFDPHEVTKIVEQIRYLNVVERSECDKDLHIINTETGLLNLNTMKTSPHTSDYLSIIQIPIKYDPTKTCPEFIKFIHESVSKSDINNLLDSIAYILWRKNEKEIINFPIGQGYNGKTLLISTITEVIGQRNTANISLSRILNDRFVDSLLVGKLVNFAPDTKRLFMDDVTELKIRVGKQRKVIEGKFKDSYEVDNNPKYWFPINELGNIGDNSDGTDRRFNLMKFNQKYKDELTEEEKNDPTHEYKLANPDLENTLKSEKEGIFILMVNRLNDLRKRKFKFELSARKTRELRELLQNTNSIFTDIHIEFIEYNFSSPNSYKDRFEFKELVFTELDKFCKEREIPTPTRDSISKYLTNEIERRYKNDRNKNTFQYHTKRLNGLTGKREWGYYGLHLLSENEIELRQRLEDIEIEQSQTQTSSKDNDFDIDQFQIVECEYCHKLLSKDDLKDHLDNDGCKVKVKQDFESGKYKDLK